MITVKDLKAKVAPKMHGTNLSKFGTIYPEMAEAAANMLIRVDPPDTIQKTRIGNAIYNFVYNYTCPVGLKGIDRVLDIRPIGPRNRWDDMTINAIKQFDIKKYRNSMVIETINGIKTLRISKLLCPPASQPVTISYLNAIFPTITYGGDVTNMVVDTLDYIAFSSSLSFTLSGVTGVGNITYTSPNFIDLSQLLNLGAIFHWLKFANAARFTSMTLQFGNNSSNYWSVSVTTPVGRTAVDTNAWDLMEYDWVNSTQTGSPVANQLTYFNIIFNYTTGTSLAFNKVNAMTASLGAVYEIVYYTNYIFQDAVTGTLKAIPTADSDIIMLDPAATNILMYETQKVLVQQMTGRNAAADLNLINYTLDGVQGRTSNSSKTAAGNSRIGLYEDYIAQNPSQAIPPQQTYYEFDNLNGFGEDGESDSGYQNNNG